MLPIESQIKNSISWFNEIRVLIQNSCILCTPLFDLIAKLQNRYNTFVFQASSWIFKISVLMFLYSSTSFPQIIVEFVLYAILWPELCDIYLWLNFSTYDDHEEPDSTYNFKRSFYSSTLQSFSLGFKASNRVEFIYLERHCLPVRVLLLNFLFNYCAISYQDSFSSL